MQLCFFEDKKCENFRPLNLTRPTDDLRVGILTIAEKWRLNTDNAKWTRCIRPELNNVFKNSAIDENEPYLWVNSRFLPSTVLMNKINSIETGTVIKQNGTATAAKATGKTTAEWLRAGKPDFSSFEVFDTDSLLYIKHLWDLFLMNEAQIEADIETLNVNATSAAVSGQAILQNEENILIDEGAEIRAGAILIADKGLIYIGKNATVSAGAIIEGPAAICEKAVIKPKANIHSNTTVGPVCKVGGEVSDTIFHSYSNKGHNGYLGHSLIGQWCNLGAGTNNSNLKNNYSEVRLTDWETKQTIETGQQFLGMIMGDHSKTAIGTRLNTGTVCGVNCNIFSVDFPPKYIPSFSWVGSDRIETYKLAKAFETMRAVMARRNVELTDNYKELMRMIFDKSGQTADDKRHT